LIPYPPTAIDLISDNFKPGTSTIPLIRPLATFSLMEKGEAETYNDIENVEGGTNVARHKASFGRKSRSL